MRTFYLLLSFMLFFLGSTLSIVQVGAENDPDSFNSTGFIINLGPMDPLGESHASGGADAWWLDALMVVLWNFTDILLFILPTLAGISLLIAGYFYIFSAGDSEKAGRAKTIIKWNIVALLVGFFSYAIVRIVASFFNT